MPRFIQVEQNNGSFIRLPEDEAVKLIKAKKAVRAGTMKTKKEEKKAVETAENKAMGSSKTKASKDKK